MYTILITGGAGFLGSWFVRDWLAAKAGRAVVLDKLTYAGHLGSLAAVRDDPRFVFRHGDIGDRPLVAALLDEFEPAAIVNFAAETHVDRSIDAPAPFVSTNVCGTAQLLEATAKYWQRLGEDKHRSFRFLHISTDEVFGPIPSPHRAAETAPYHPSSPYAASKAAADHFVRAYHRTYGMPVLLVHPSNCYGSFQFPEKLVPLAILNALDGRPIPLYGDGRHERDWLYGGDLSVALRRILQDGRPGESYNVATGRERTNLDLVTAICDRVDELATDLPHRPCHNLIEHVPDRPGHDQRYALDIAKTSAFGWTPADPSDGLRRTVQWYIDNRAWVAEVSANFDRTKRMGLALR